MTGRKSAPSQLRAAKRVALDTRRLIATRSAVVATQLPRVTGDMRLPVAVPSGQPNAVDLPPRHLGPGAIH
jgi:hypothetical protein